MTDGHPVSGAHGVLTVGEIAVNRVEEVRIPNSIAYFTQDQALIAAHRDWLSPHYLDADDRFDLVFQSWVFEADGRVVLVDPCTGNGKPHPVPYFDMLDVPFIERLEATGVGATDVDLVVCTHLHHDHCGWNTMLRDGKWVPTFPRARYIMQQAEYDRWGRDRDLYPAPPYNDSVFERSVQPVVEAGLAELVAGNHRLAPGMEVQSAPGHTIGHQMLHLASAGRQAWFTGDCFHHPLQLIEPSIPFGDADSLEQAMATRRALVELAVAHDALLIAAHLPAPHGVKVARLDGKLRFSAGAVA